MNNGLIGFTSPLCGIPVTVNYSLCDTKKKYVRRHRKSRINKKWEKRYGANLVVEKECSGVSYQVRGAIFCCPHVFDQLQKLGVQ